MNLELLTEARNVLERTQPDSPAIPAIDRWLDNVRQSRVRREARDTADADFEATGLRALAEAGLPLSCARPEPGPDGPRLSQDELLRDLPTIEHDPDSWVWQLREARKQRLATLAHLSEGTGLPLRDFKDLAGTTELARLLGYDDAEPDEPGSGTRAMREAGLPLRGLDDADREDYDDLDDDELESASSISSGEKRRRKPSSAREITDGTRADEPEEDAGSLTEPVAVVREADAVQALADAGCASFYRGELPPAQPDARADPDDPLAGLPLVDQGL